MFDKPQAAYEELVRRARELSVLTSCSALLGWDEQTYMPSGGSAHRSEQLAHLAGLHHERATDPRIGDWFAVIEESDLTADPESAPAVNVRELRRNYDRLVKLPRGLVESLAQTTSLAQQQWVEARRIADFGQFRPWLQRIVELKRQEAECLAGTPDREAGVSDSQSAANATYDALLDEYEPGARSAELAVLFRALREELIPVGNAISEAAARRARDEGTSHADSDSCADTILKRAFPLDRQKVFGEAVAAAVGFDFQRGRLDVTAHPFCSGIGPGDTRLTTRYDEHNFGDAFFGILHEVGHGLYEQGLPADHYGTPLGEAASLGVHESQSRLWENAVGRSRAFWLYWFPLARRIFPQTLSDVSLDQFLAAINHVCPSLIRVKADEVTYNLHIIIRFELEQALLSGNLPVRDLPGAWNQTYHDVLGVRPTNDAEGCLQDIHWSAGLFGYFPTYTLGNVYAAQLISKARSDLAGLDGSFARGDCSDLLAWLRDKVHRHGRRYRPASLVEHATGAKPDHRPLVASLRQKYGDLYALSATL